MSEGTVNKLSVMTILVLVLGVVVLTTIAIIGGYSEFLRDATTSNRSASTDITDVTNISGVLVGTTGQFPFLTDLNNCVTAVNATALTKNVDYTFTKGTSNGGSVILTNAGNTTLIASDNDLNCSTISFKADSDSQASADQFQTGVAIFGTFSAIIVLAIVGIAIIGLFRRKD